MGGNTSEPTPCSASARSEAASAPAPAHQRPTATRARRPPPPVGRVAEPTGGWGPCCPVHPVVTTAIHPSSARERISRYVRSPKRGEERPSGRPYGPLGRFTIVVVRVPSSVLLPLRLVRRCP